MDQEGRGEQGHQDQPTAVHRGTGRVTWLADGAPRWPVRGPNDSQFMVKNRWSYGVDGGAVDYGEGYGGLGSESLRFVSDSSECVTTPCR